MYTQWFSQYLAFINRLAECRGKRSALAYNKLLRLSVTRYLSNEPLPKRTPGINLSTDGLPVAVHFLHPTIRMKSIDDLRIIFTMLNLSRGVVLEPENNFKTIVDPWEGTLPTSWKAFQPAIKRSLGYRRARYNFDSLHTSTKSGPNGQAMLTSYQDYLSLPEPLVNALVELGGPKIQDIFTRIFEPINGITSFQLWYQLNNSPLPEMGEIRRLSTFGDKEGKTRIIGILDY